MPRRRRSYPALVAANPAASAEPAAPHLERLGAATQLIVDGPPIAGVESIDEQLLLPGGTVAGRRLNGDESGRGQSRHLFAGEAAQNRIYRVRLYRPR